MTQATAKTRQPAPARFGEGGNGMAALKGMEIFAAGTHRGKTYTVADLDAMVANFERFCVGQSPALRVPAVIGHSEEQEFLERSDLPAAGWCERVYREGSILKADIADVPPAVARLLEQKAYRKVSAEVYDEPPAGLVGGMGRTLRRVAYLGGEIPQVKNLSDIPAPSYGEGRFAPAARRLLRSGPLKLTKVLPSKAGTFHVFSESSMTREEMLAKLQEMGFDVSLITDQVPDNVLAECLRACEQMKGQAAQPPAQGQMGEAGNVATPGTVQGVADSGTRQPAQVIMKYGEKEILALVQPALKGLVDETVKQIRQEFAGVRQQTAELAANTKRANITKFCEAMRDAGKIQPWELDDTNPKVPSLVERMMGLDAKTVVRKFTENGKEVAQTALDMEMAAIEARKPALKFGERFKDPKGQASSEDAEVAKVEQHFEQFSETFEKYGQTKDKLVAGYKAARKLNTKITANEFLQVA